MSSEKNNDRNKIEIPEIFIPPIPKLEPLVNKPTAKPTTYVPVADRSHVVEKSSPNLPYNKSSDDTLAMSKPVNGELDTIMLTHAEIATPKFKLQKMNPLQIQAVDWLAANFRESSDEATIKDTPDVLRSKITGTYSAKTLVEKNMMNENYAEQVNNIAMSKAFRDSSDYKKFMISKDGQQFKDSNEGKEYLLAVTQNDYAAQRGNNVPRAKPAGATKVTSR